MLKRLTCSLRIYGILLSHVALVAALSNLRCSSSSETYRSAGGEVCVHMSRTVVKTVESKEQSEGDGARVRRSVGSHELRNLDPFLMLDEFRVQAPAGFPDHPHRGFETVTYVLQGACQHEDFSGSKGTIGPGDLQWMTAGRGIVHAEMPFGSEAMYGLQLWVNLSKANKMVAPAYQELKDKDIPRGQKDGVQVKVIAGESMGIKSPVYTRTPTMYLDFTLEPQAKHRQAIPAGWTAFAYVLEGTVAFGPSGSQTQGLAHYTIVFSDGDTLDIENKGSIKCRIALVAGQPLNEPIVQHGPFVMNSEEEIRQAISDYSNGRNGFEKAIEWQSAIAAGRD